jgi:hypothetical protein
MLKLKDAFAKLPARADKPRRRANPPATARRPKGAVRPRVSTPPPSSSAVVLAAERTGTITRAEAQAANTVFEQLTREEISQVLIRAAVGASDRQLVQLAEMLGDPGFDPARWPALCSAAGVAPAKVMRALIDTYIDDASLVAARGIPKIAQSLVNSSVERVETCYVCDGAKTVPVLDERSGADRRITCRNCSGSGKLHVPADLAAAKLVTGILGMNQQGPMVAIQNNNQRGPRNSEPPTNGGVPDMSDWCSSTDGVFEERRRGALAESAEE